jgi:hypothetical protein
MFGKMCTAYVTTAMSQPHKKDQVEIWELVRKGGTLTVPMGKGTDTSLAKKGCNIKTYLSNEIMVVLQHLSVCTEEFLHLFNMCFLYILKVLKQNEVVCGHK